MAEWITALGGIGGIIAGQMGNSPEHTILGCLYLLSFFILLIKRYLKTSQFLNKKK